MSRQGKMKDLEQQQGRPLEEILQEAFEKHGTQVAVAAALDVSQSTISTWLMRLGLAPQVTLVPAANNDKAVPLRQDETRPEVCTRNTSSSL